MPRDRHIGGRSAALGRQERAVAKRQRRCGTTLGRVDTVAPGVQRTPYPGRVSRVGNVETPSVRCCWWWRGRPTKTARVDGGVALTSQARAELVVRLHGSRKSWQPRAVMRVYIPKAGDKTKLRPVRAVTALLGHGRYQLTPRAGASRYCSPRSTGVSSRPV
jgi:hypothetical protein